MNKLNKEREYYKRKNKKKECKCKRKNNWLPKFVNYKKK